MAERGGDFFCSARAVMRAPARHQPRRQVKRLRRHLVDQGLCFARATAQHGVDEAGIFGGAAVGLYQPHRQIDRGVIGHVHPENLRGADQQRALRARGVGGNSPIQQTRQHMSECAQSAQDRRHQPAHQRAIAIGKRFQPGMRAAAFKLLVEGPVFVQHAVEDVRRNPPRREAGHLDGRCESDRRHGRETSLAENSEGLPFRRNSSRDEHRCHMNMPNVRIGVPVP